MDRSPSKWQLLVVLLVVVATLPVADPHRSVVDDGTRYVVQPTIAPSQLWAHAQRNTLQKSYTATLRVWPADGDELQLKWVIEYNPNAHRYLGRIYSRSNGTGNWTASQLFLGEAVKATRLGESPAPNISRNLTDSVSRSHATPSGFEPLESVTDSDLDTDEFRHLKTTDTRLVIGVTDAGDYADLHNLDEERVLSGSAYRVSIDRDTGRIVRIIDRRRLADPEASTPAIDTRRVWTFTRYGKTPAKRPVWASWNPLELAYDALSL